MTVLIHAFPDEADAARRLAGVLNSPLAFVETHTFPDGEVLPRVKVPMTGIWGEFDSTTYPHIQERIDLFRALQPDFQMNVIEGAGHWVAYEAAEAFNAKLIEVLGR